MGEVWKGFGKEEDKYEGVLGEVWVKERDNGMLESEAGVEGWLGRDALSKGWG